MMFAKEGSVDGEIEHAATVVQRNYRGYRARRQLQGLALTSSERWFDAVREARYRNLIKPRPRTSRSEYALGEGEARAVASPDGTSFAQSEWRRLRDIARRAGNDDTSDTDGVEDMTPVGKESYQSRKREAKKQCEADAKMMGLEYFLEMVDLKHRYGSHLRSYHAIWLTANTNENFFYWLDYGDGRNVEALDCTRARLHQDQVRYLSREERQHYLVQIDGVGRLCWAKNAERVNTSSDFRDSMKGIVHLNDRTPEFRESTTYALHRPVRTGNGNRDDRGDDEGDPKAIVGSPLLAESSSSLSSSDTESSLQDGDHYVDQDFKQAKGVQKIQHVSAATLLNHLLQSTTKKNTWIFVVDTSFRLYIGIKQSGAFQHSSFLQGRRVSAAGLIKVKNGQLRQLSPLSGHYRPPTKMFRAFVSFLREEGVDMTRVSISRSYAILLGLEGYLKTKKRAKRGVADLAHRRDKMLHPEEAKRKENDRIDKSQSARREQEFLEEQRRKEREARRQDSLGRKLERLLSQPK